MWLSPEIFENNLRITVVKEIQDIVSFPAGKYWTLKRYQSPTEFLLIYHNSADIGKWS
jgi:hypothetical protein